jgi:phosphatidylserine/phosphatidylglycerophosphate/cardiolipin synthase-like enzyme
MRKHKTNGDIRVNVVAGNHVVLLAMDAGPSARKGLLGFAIERTDHATGEKSWLRGTLTFEETSHEEHQPGHTEVESDQHPIQDFRWSDYQAEPDSEYSYRVIPVYGSPTAPRHGKSITVRIKTESVRQHGHSVFFNRAVAGSQGYVHKFGDVRPDDVPNREAYDWLSRGLERGLLDFIAQADGPGFGLRAAVYEFQYLPVLQAFKQANRQGADVKIVFDCKDPEGSPGKGNLAAIKKAGIKRLTIPRTASPSAIAHNKFIILLEDGKPHSVWTGSTNITDGAIFGHSNVGHIVHDAEVAQAYLDYWEQLAQDVPSKDLRKFNETNSPVIGDPSRNHQPIASPRASLEALNTYAKLMDDSSGPVFLTAAFGISNEFADVLGKPRDYLRYVLMDNLGQKGNKQNYDKIKGVENNRIALGDTIRDDNELAGWHAERLTGLNTHVKYVHTKYMLLDPFGECPTIITGSANFSKASTQTNDENMVILRDCPGPMDVYITEFMRMFSHFEFRNKLNASYDKKRQQFNKWLTPDGSWTKKYFDPDTIECREREFFCGEHVAKGYKKRYKRPTERAVRTLSRDG